MRQKCNWNFDDCPDPGVDFFVIHVAPCAQFGAVIGICDCMPEKFWLCAKHWDHYNGNPLT